MTTNELFNSLIEQSQADLIEMAVALHEDLGTKAPAYKHWSKGKIAQAIIDMQNNEGIEVVEATDSMAAIETEIAEKAAARDAAEEEVLIVGKRRKGESKVASMKALRAKIRNLIDDAIAANGEPVHSSINGIIDLGVTASTNAEGKLTVSFEAWYNTGGEQDAYVTTDQRALYRWLGDFLGFEKGKEIEPSDTGYNEDGSPELPE